MKKVILAGIAVASVLALSACSASSGTQIAKPGSESLTKITVGIIPIVDDAPIYLGVQQGFFKKHGLDVTLKAAAGGSDMVPAVFSGSFDFAFGSVVSVMQAVGQGLDLRFVAAGDTPAGIPDTGAVLVPKDSPIKKPSDLVGKTVSNANLGTVADLTTDAAVAKDGADPAKIKWTKVNYPDAEAALANKQVDAAFIVDPFLSAAVAAGYRVISYPFHEFDPELPIAAYFASGKMIKNKPELVKKFADAMNESSKYAEGHTDAVRAIVGTYTKFSPDQLKKISVNHFPGTFNLSAATALGDMLMKYGTLKKIPDFNVLFPKQ